jgi:hypothetical protein
LASTDQIRIEVWTERFLGTPAKAAELLPILEGLDGGRWSPEKWGHYEPVRQTYLSTSRANIIAAFSESRSGRIANQVNFGRSKPQCSIAVDVWRSRVPGMNNAHLDLEAGAFSSPDGPERIVSIVEDMVRWSNAAFASARHSSQLHWRVAMKTPRERIQQVNWLTFWGRPYVDFFGGREKMLSAPCHVARECGTGIMMIASPRPDSAEMVTNDSVLLDLESYLGKSAFAGYGYPEIPCRTPAFDLSETVL